MWFFIFSSLSSLSNELHKVSQAETCMTEKSKSSLYFIPKEFDIVKQELKSIADGNISIFHYLSKSNFLLKISLFSNHKNQRLDNFVLTNNIQILESSKFLLVYQASLSFARRVEHDVHLVSVVEATASTTC